MEQRGRKSAAALATVSPFPQRLLQPPDDLTHEEAAVWAGLVGSMPGDWWNAGNTPLLAQYCRAQVQSGTVAELVRQVLGNLVTDPDELSRYKELRKIQGALSAEMNTLARAMRLTQQSHYRADKGVKKVSGKKPWQSSVVEG